MSKGRSSFAAIAICFSASILPSAGAPGVPAPVPPPIKPVLPRSAAKPSNRQAGIETPVKAPAAQRKSKELLHTASTPAPNTQTDERKLRLEGRVSVEEYPSYFNSQKDVSPEQASVSQSEPSLPARGSYQLDYFSPKNVSTNPAIDDTNTRVVVPSAMGAAQSLFSDALKAERTPTDWPNVQVVAPAIFSTESNSFSRSSAASSFCDPCYLMHQGRWQEAIKLFEELLANPSAPDRPQLLSDYAWGLAHVGKINQALKNVELALRDAQGGTKLYDDAHGTRGFILLKKGKYKEAMEDLSIATAGRPWDADAWHNFGMALQKLGKTDQANCALSRAISLGYRE